jgi:hypothetical protein
VRPVRNKHETRGMISALWYRDRMP